MQTELFAAREASACWQPLALAGASVWLRQAVLPAADGHALLDELVRSVPWRRDRVRMFGKQHALPRLQQWYGEPGRVYTWSGIEMQPLAWTRPLARLRALVQRATARELDAVLVNYYRDGNDTVGWHADDEPELGPTPFIASLSLGATRDFVLRRVAGGERVTIALEHCSLLVMAGDTQRNWQHALPRRKRVSGPRINLTFRCFA
jgi:alkylated DNA repair dioxygenase AlkB